MPAFALRAPLLSDLEQLKLLGLRLAGLLQDPPSCALQAEAARLLTLVDLEIKERESCAHMITDIISIQSAPANKRSAPAAPEANKGPPFERLPDRRSDAAGHCLTSVSTVTSSTFESVEPTSESQSTVCTFAVSLESGAPRQLSAPTHPHG